MSKLQPGIRKHFLIAGIIGGVLPPVLWWTILMLSMIGQLQGLIMLLFLTVPVFMVIGNRHAYKYLHKKGVAVINGFVTVTSMISLFATLFGGMFILSPLSIYSPSIVGAILTILFYYANAGNLVAKQEPKKPPYQDPPYHFE